MKRIALHVIILIMAVVSMVCAGKATVIEEIEYHGMTSDEAKNIYIEHYASGIQEILGKFYVEMNGKKLLGESRNARFQEVSFNENVNWNFEETGLLYCVTKENEIENVVTNMDNPDSIKGVAASFGENGLGLYGEDKGKLDIQIFEAMKSRAFDNISSFYYYADIANAEGIIIDTKRIVVSYDELKKFCKENQLTFIIQTNDDYTNTYLGQLKQTIKKNITQKDIEACRNRVLTYVFICGSFYSVSSSIFNISRNIYHWK